MHRSSMMLLFFSPLVSYFDFHSFKLNTLHYISYYHSYCRNLCTTFINVCMCGIHDDCNTNDMSASRKREHIKKNSKKKSEIEPSFCNQMLHSCLEVSTSIIINTYLFFCCELLTQNRWQKPPYSFFRLRIQNKNA